MKEKETIQISKDSLMKGTIVVLAILLIVSIFTGGFSGKGNSAAPTPSDENNNGVDIPAPNLKVLEDSSLFPSIGPANAKHTVIEFSDFQCPYCAIAAGLSDWAKTLSTQYSDLFNSAGKIEDMAKSGELRFVYVSMSFLGQESVDATQAALCANDQGKFWEMHDLLFSAHDGKENNGKFTKENLKTIAKAVSGLDTTKFNSCLDDDDKLSDVKKVASTASQFASGTPTFYIDGQKASSSWAQMSALLN